MILEVGSAKRRACFVSSHRSRLLIWDGNMALKFCIVGCNYRGGLFAPSSLL